MAYLLIKPPHSRDDDNNRSNELWHPHIPAPKYKMPKGQAQLFVVDRWFTKKSTVAISFGIVGAEVQDDGDACYSI